MVSPSVLLHKEYQYFHVHYIAEFYSKFFARLKETTEPPARQSSNQRISSLVIVGITRNRKSVASTVESDYEHRPAGAGLSTSTKQSKIQDSLHNSVYRAVSGIPFVARFHPTVHRAPAWCFSIHLILVGTHDSPFKQLLVFFDIGHIAGLALRSGTMILEHVAVTDFSECSSEYT